MRATAGWLARNVDPVLAIVVALVVGILDILSDVSLATLTGGVLLVLGVLSIAVLRDRHRDDSTERELREELRRAGELAPALTAMHSTVMRLDGMLDDAAMVHVLTGPQVTQALTDARRGTDRWIFRGGTGTYIRAVTLPECVASARRDRRTLQIRLEIIDPTDERVCQSYVSFRHSLSTDPSGWTVERAQRESYATIVACAWHRQRYELLDVQIGLSRVMPTLRWDLSADCLIVTQESRHKPAMLVEHGKLLYTYMQTELRQSLEQARPVPLEVARHAALSDQPTCDEIRRLFRALNMPLPSSITDQDVRDIIARALHAENMYDL
jgi:hypothetical protein